MNTKPKEKRPLDAPRLSKTINGAQKSNVVVFLSDANDDTSPIRHAQEIASAFSGKVVLVHVMSKPVADTRPVDPVDWDIKKRKALNWLERAARSIDRPDQKCDARLLEGQCLGQIRATMDERPEDIAAALRPRNSHGWQTSEMASGVLLSRSAAILMIPEDTTSSRAGGYRRILVPLDGSTRAEAALPMATMLASAKNAELVLCYVAPEPGLTEFGVKDQDAERLHQLVKKRNEQAGKSYLARVKNGLVQNRHKVSTRILREGDVRRVLLDAVSHEAADLLVMATHGQGGHNDVPVGDVARFVLDRADVPVLMVRHRRDRNGNHAFRKPTSAGVRKPAGTN